MGTDNNQPPVDDGGDWVGPVMLYIAVALVIMLVALYQVFLG